MSQLARAKVVMAVLLAVAARLAYAQEPSTGVAPAAALENAIVAAIAGCERSVVAIARVRKQAAADTPSLEFRPDAFGRRTLPVTPPQPSDPDFIPNEYGTGVVVDARGLILTAYHLLAEESDYYVTTHDRKVYRATIKGADPRSDLAILAVDAAGMAPISLGDASELKKGQIVLTLGNPYGVARDGQPSAGWGIVANLARKAPPTPGESDPSGKPTLHHFGTLIQTDARLNLGTSGGPLLNLKGQMIGLIVALAATTGYESAGGYAIPVDPTFRRVLETLKQGREVEYGFLGVQSVNLSAQEIHSGLHGMRIDRIVPGTPAAHSALKPDDIITAVGERAIYDVDGLVLEVGKLPVEAVVRLSLLRGGYPRTLDVTLGKYPVQGKKIITEPAPDWRGMRVDYATALLDADPRARIGWSFSDEGVLVTDVQEDSPASAAGLRRGMLVSHVGRISVRTPKEFRAAVGGKTGPVQLRIVGDADSGLRTVAGS